MKIVTLATAACVVLSAWPVSPLPIPWGKTKAGTAAGAEAATMANPAMSEGPSRKSIVEAAARSSASGRMTNTRKKSVQAPRRGRSTAIIATSLHAGCVAGPCRAIAGNGQPEILQK